MKRFLPFLAAMLIGCAGSAPPPTHPLTKSAELAPEPPPSPPPVSDPSYVARGAWSIELPARWVFNDVEKRDGDVKQVLEALSTYDVGRGPMRISISTMRFEGPDLVFAQAAAALADQFIPRSTVLARRMVLAGERPASLSLLLTKGMVGVAVLATGVNGLGYVVTCSGDISKRHFEHVVTQTCESTLKTFRVR